MSSEIAIALNDNRIMTCKQEAIKSSLTVMVSSVFTMAGQEMKEKDLAAIIREVSKDLQTRYKSLTLEEVKIALDNGVRGDYGQYMGINVVSINGWLKAYMNSDERKKAIRDKSPQLALPAYSGPSEEEFDELMTIKIGEAKAEYDNTGNYRDRGNVLCRYLQRIGEIKLSKEENWQIVLQAIKELRKDANQNKQMLKNRMILSAIEDEINEKGFSKREIPGEVIRKCRCIAINRYLAELK